MVSYKIVLENRNYNNWNIYDSNNFQKKDIDINPIEDKFDALIGYKYHLALENSVIPDYWTEKLADSLLAWCKPIYYGCPNINDYFSSSFKRKAFAADFQQGGGL